MSVATLGLAVDSSQANAATKALNGLTAAAKPAAQAAADLSKASSAGAAALGGHTNATNANAHAHAGLSTQAMAAQHSIRSMVEQLAMGIPPTQILTGQLNHLSYAASGPGGLKGAFTEALGAFRSFLSPTALIVGGLAAVAGGAVLAVNSVAKLAQQFQDSARAASISVGQLQGFAAAASFKGIDNKDFLSAIDKFSASVYDAKNNMGGLADVLTANHKRAGDLVQDFGAISDLIKSATGNTQLQFSILQQAGLPATMQWVRFLSQGKDAIAAQAAEFTKNGSQMDALAAKAHDFSEAWDKAIANLKFGFQGAVLSIVGFFDTLSNKATSVLMHLPGIGASVPTNMLRNALTNNAAGYQTGSKLSASSSVDQFYSPLGTNAPGNAQLGGSPVDHDALRKQIALYQQYVGLLGQQASTQQIIASVQKQIQLYNLTPGAIALTKQQVDTMKQLAVEQAIGVTAIKSQVDAYNVETATIGMSAGAAAQYAAAQNAINEAKRVGRPLTAENIAAINAEAAALGQAAQTADTLRFAYSGLVQGPLQTFSQAIQNGSNFFDALKKAGISALDALANKLADIAAQNLWKAAFGGASSGGGLLSLFGFGGGAAASSGLSLTATGGLYHSGGIVGSEPTAMRYVHPAYFDDAPRFHTGLMPDEFPAILQKGEGVFTKGQMAAMGAGGGPQNVHVTVGVSVDNDGNLQAYVKDVAQTTSNKTVSDTLKSPQFVDRVASANKRASTRRLGA